jgi:predicted nucleic acid-binding protein
VTDLWIVNASPVIVLAKVEQLQLLQRLCQELLVPQAVVMEILTGPSSDPARQALEQGWGKVAVPKNIPPELLEWGLGPGETAVLAMSLERKSSAVVLDDAAARNCAKTLGLEVIGTLGVILRAKRKGLIPSAAELLKKLRKVGLHLDNKVVDLALHGIGETWE